MGARVTVFTTSESKVEDAKNLGADEAVLSTIKMQAINEAYERLEKGDVKYRFVVDMASLKN